MASVENKKLRNDVGDALKLGCSPVGNADAAYAAIAYLKLIGAPISQELLQTVNFLKDIGKTKKPGILKRMVDSKPSLTATTSADPNGLVTQMANLCLTKEETEIGKSARNALEILGLPAPKENNLESVITALGIGHTRSKPSKNGSEIVEIMTLPGLANPWQFGGDHFEPLRSLREQVWLEAKRIKDKAPNKQIVATMDSIIQACEDINRVQIDDHEGQRGALVALYNAIISGTDSEYVVIYPALSWRIKQLINNSD